jgi:hypothetical protein
MRPRHERHQSLQRLLCHPDGERGAVAIIVGVSMVALLGITALVVDIGWKLSETSHAQTGADAAAIAAIRYLDEGTHQDAAFDYLARNGLDTVTAEVNSPPTSGAHAGDADCIEVIAHEDADAAFAPVVGVDTLDADARAVACGVREGFGFPAIFAGATTCGRDTLSFSQSDSTFTGVHSNDDLVISQSNNIFTPGSVTYSGEVTNSGASNTFEENDPSFTLIKDWPFTADINDYKPGGAKASAAGAAYYNAGSNKIDKQWLKDQGLYDETTRTVQPGLYYSSGNIEIREIEQIDGGGGVTFVSLNGTITLDGNNDVLRPWDPDGLLLFSDKGPSCTNIAITAKGNNADWSGIIYAPRARVALDANNGTSLNGAVIAYTVTIQGNGGSIIRSDNLADYRLWVLLKE